MGGGNEGSSTTPIQSPIVSALGPLLEQFAPGILGNVANFTGQFPLSSIIPLLGSPQQISPLGPQELQLIGQEYGISQAPAITPEETAALGQIGQLIGGPIGSSPATKAGMDAFTKLQLPGIEQGAALAGLSHGGAMPELIEQGQSAALLPLIQQEISNRMNLVPNLEMLGGSLANRQQSNIQAAMGATALPRQVADSQNAANYASQINLANAIQGIGTGAFNSFLSPILGAASTPGQKTSTQSPGLFSK